MLLTTAGVLAILALAAGAGVALRVLQDDNKNGSSQESLITQGQPLPKKVEDAQNLRSTGDTKAAQTAIDEGLANASVSQDERYLLYIQQGNTYTDTSDYANAIKSYEQASAIKETYETTTLLAEAWRTAGNNAKAVEYLKKALPLIPDTPMKSADKSRLEERIRSLGGTV
jgi:tetratricopeptide (TPR) repeat protein